MRYRLLLSVITIVFTGTAFGQNGSIQVGGVKRSYILHVPSSGLPENPSFVISLHGLNNNATIQRSWSGFDNVADKEKFIVVYPEAINMSWDLSGTTDVNFIAALIDTMYARYHIDRKRVYATGMSMGGMFSYTLACKAADKIAAIGPGSGYLMGGLGNCSPSRPVPTFHVHGEADTFVSYKNLLPIFAAWVKLNGCPDTPVVTKPYPADNASSKATKKYYGPCRENSEVILVSVAGMAHDYATAAKNFGIIESEEFWKFFKNHSLGSVGISHPATIERTGQRFSTAYHAGKIRIQSAREIRSVRIFDIQGKAIHSWKAGVGSIRSIDLPVSRSAGGIYLLNVVGSSGSTTLKIVAP
jgi:poly(3-hydroxybutyrate) depolymerase